MLFEFTEIAVDKARRTPEIRQSSTRGLQGLLVLIYPDQHAAGGATFQNLSGMTTSTQGAVQVNTARVWIQELNDLLR